MPSLAQQNAGVSSVDGSYMADLVIVASPSAILLNIQSLDNACQFPESSAGGHTRIRFMSSSYASCSPQLELIAVHYLLLLRARSFKVTIEC